jgi:DNA gyrase subunit A
MERTDMTQESREVEALLIEDEMKDAYLTFAMSVIISRALPDVRDGLKPVQRRIMVGMHDLNLGPRSKTRKCGKIVGDVHGNYHPHGEVAIYDTLVRMAQPFTMRYALVDSQGNFGSMDGDPPAAQRYTEARLSYAGMELLQDLDLETVDFTDNYDNTRQEPTVLPARLPNLLANGAAGIAVGMATSIPPHNLRELCDAIVAVLDRPGITVPELMEIMPGPDFPTGGVICGRQGIYEGYATGRGTIVLRARTHFEDARSSRRRIVVTEVPWRADRDSIVSKIAEAVQAGRVEDVQDIRNESDKSGTRLVVELKREADEQVVLNQLFQHTPLQSTVSIILIAVVDGRPETLTIKRAIELYIAHRRDVIRRRTGHLLRRAEERAHVLEGLKVAIINIDEVIAIIRSSREVAEARARLMEKFGLTERQVDAIVSMQLRSLVGLERLKVEKEHEELTARIAEYKAILADPAKVDEIVRQDLRDIREKYGDERRTDITEEAQILLREDLVAEEDVVVTVSHRGYVKRTRPDTFRAQGRGGKGVIGADLQDEDFVCDIFTASTHDYVLFFTNFGQVYWLKVFMIPEMDRTARGRALVNLLALQENEKITGMVPLRAFEEDYYLLMVTAYGTLKKTSLDAFGRRGSGGIIAIALAEGDQLIGVRKTDGEREVVLGTCQGQAIRFHERDIRPTGRAAAGVRGIRLQEGDRVVDMALVREGTTLLSVCANGYGKRTQFAEYPPHRRGGKGVIGIQTSERNGEVVAMREVADCEELILITERGMTVRIPASSVSCIGRSTQGVKLITTEESDRLSSIAVVEPEEDADEPPAGNEARRQPVRPPTGGLDESAPDEDAPDASA